MAPRPPSLATSGGSSSCGWSPRRWLTCSSGFSPDRSPASRTDVVERAVGQQSDFAVLLLIAIPVVLGVFIYLGYASIVWRARRAGTPDPLAGRPPAPTFECRSRG